MGGRGLVCILVQSSAGPAGFKVQTGSGSGVGRVVVLGYKRANVTMCVFVGWGGVVVKAAEYGAT
jgi:hypothetical protein